MQNPQQDSDQESDSLAVTKTSPMIIRLCTNLTEVDKDQLSSENSPNSGNTNLKFEEMNYTEPSNQKYVDVSTVKDPIKTEVVTPIKSLKLTKEDMCPYANIDNVSVKANIKSECSPVKALNSLNCKTDNLSAKFLKAKLSSLSSQASSGVKMETIKDASKIEDMKESNSLKGNLEKDPSNYLKVKDSCRDDTMKDSIILQSFNPNYHRCVDESGSLETKGDDWKQKPSSPKAKVKSNDSVLNQSVAMQSSNLFSTNILEDDNNSKLHKLESETLRDPAKTSEINRELNCEQLDEKQSKKSTVSPSSYELSKGNTLVKSETNLTDSMHFSHSEKLLGKRKKQYRSRKSFSSSDESNDAFKGKGLFLETANATHVTDKSAVSSFKPNLKIEDDVGGLEINELEKIREALKQQLLQDVDASPEMVQSNDLIKTEKNAIDFSMKPTCVQLTDQAIDNSLISELTNPATLYREIPQRIEHSFEEHFEDSSDHSVNAFNCFLHVIKDQPSVEQPKVIAMDSPREKPSNIENVPETSPVNAVERAEEKVSDVNSTIEQPPLVMQSSNLLFNDELDNRHGGGGIETTQIKEEEPVTKKLKLSDDNNEIALENGNTSINESKIISPNDDFEKQSIQQDDLASNSTLDPLNSEQNGVMEFDILDEFESDDNEPNESDSDDSDLSMDEIDAMLEEGLQNSKGIGNKDLEHEEKEKVILKVRGRDHFDVLPEGWIEVTHNSGMPIYLHKQTRVCSVSKPYFLGPGSTRKHKIPVSAIPCLHYLREIEKESSQPSVEENPEISNGTPEKLNDSAEIVDNKNVISKDVDNVPEKVNSACEKNSGSENINASTNIIPSAKLESVKDTKESGSLDYLAVRDYCKKRFEFQTITVKRFRTWSGRRKHQKQLKRKQRPYLPDSTKLITCPLYSATDKTSTLGNNAKREFIMNPSGKSPVCILHEYVQHTLRVQPKYIFKELESANTPYGAVVIIDGIEYGCGFGSSKKLAKSDAAKSALQILIPKMKMFAPETQNGEETQDVEFFDQVRVEDPRVCDLSVKAGQPYPYQILLECLKRNYGMGDTEIEFWMTNLKHQKNEFFMKVGKHQVSVICKNKRDGKHRSSQAVLQQLHPHIKSWGSLLRMYGKGSCKTLKEKKEEEQRITELQSQACLNKPNMSILNKLKEEMLKYREKMISKKPIGKLIPERMEFFSTSNSNLNNVEL